MKIALAQLNYTINDIEGNLALINSAVDKAKNEGVTHLVLAASAITGTPLQDLRIDSKKIPSLKFNGIEVITEKTENDRYLFLPSKDSFSHGSPRRRINNLKLQAKRKGKTIIYVNQVGANTDTIFAGGSAVIYPDGRNELLPLFEESFHIAGEDLKSDWGNTTAQTFQALVMGIRDYFRKNGMKKAVIAMSGGIDSALVAALAVKALGSDNLRLVMLPSAYSSSHSISDSIDMAERIKVQYDIINIEPIVKVANNALRPVFFDAKADVTEENIQSRIRMVLTMAISNKTGALMLNTSNKSEVAVGYGTLYGDCGGALGVIADLYKTEVYSLARYINKYHGNIIPRHIITKVPSAELKPDQKDSDSLPGYSVLDRILYHLIEEDGNPTDSELQQYPQKDIERAYRLLYRGDFKRAQLPPPLRVSKRSFGRERIYPITKR